MKHASASFGLGRWPRALSVVSVRWLMAVGAFVLAPSAFALTSSIGAGVSYLPGSGGVTLYQNGVAVGNIGRTFAAGGTADTVAVGEALGLNVGGEALAVNAVRTVAVADVAVAAAALGGAAWAGFQVGAPIAKALGNDTFTVGDTRCTATATGWKCDDGVAPHPVHTYGKARLGGGADLTDTSVAGVCAQSAGQERGYLGTHQGGTWAVSVDQVDAPGLRCLMHYYQNDVNGAEVFNTQGWEDVTDLGMQNRCSASVDALNPAWLIAEGSPPDSDGKCKSGRYNDASPETVANRLATYGDKTAFPQVARDAIAKGATIPNATTTTLTGPASIAKAQPTVETVTNPDGSTSTKTTQTTNNYTYSPTTNTVNFTTTNVVTTTTTNASGQQTGSTTTTTQTSGQNPDDPCDKNPDRAGCAKMGEPPQADPLTKDTKNIELKPVDFASGSCPAPATFDAFGHAYQFSFAAVCDAASTWVRGVVLVVAAAIAGFVFIGGLKT